MSAYFPKLHYPTDHMSAPQIWQLTDTEFSEELELTGHEDQVYSLAWSQCGKYIATACKDGKIRSDIGNITFIHLTCNISVTGSMTPVRARSP